MNNKEVKLEYAGEICQGCLSQGRSLKPLEAYSEVFYTLLGNGIEYNFAMSSDIMKMCWECIAKLNKVQQFRMQLCQAQNRLMEMLCKENINITSLSGLSKIIKNVYDYEFHHKPIEATIYNVKRTVEPQAVVLDLETDNASLVKLEKLSDDEIKSLNEDNYTDHTDNYNDELPTKHTDTILKQEKPMKNNYLKSEKNKFKSIKKEDNSRRNKNRTYREQVLIKKLNVNFDKLSLEDAAKYFDEVYLDEIEVEEYVCKKEREVHRSFKHKCKECGIRFVATIDFYRHQNFEHHKAGTPYKCRLCNKTQPTLDSLKHHWKFSHSKFYLCKLCNAHVRIQGKTVTKHFKLQHMKKYCCTGCKMEFQTMTAFSAHYRKEHGKFICDYCGKVCLQKSVLKKHINSHHRIHECLTCVKSFKSYKTYRSHLIHLHPEKLSEKVDKEAAYCVECNKQYPSVYIFKRHLVESPRHTPQVPQSIPCPECGKIFTRKTYLRNHINHSHTSQKKFHCAMCNKSYANNWGLKCHNLNVHLKVPKVKDKICDLCGRGFNTTRILINHRRTHTGERPYSCAFCSATFAQKTAMMTHQKSQHKDLNRS